LKLLHGFNKLHELIDYGVFFHLFQAYHKAKCSVDCFFNSDLLHEQLFFLLLDLRFIFFEIGLEVILLLLRNLAFLYDFLLCLLQGHCGLFFFFLHAMKESFGHVSYSAELGRLISQLWFFWWWGRNGHCAAGVKGLLYTS
jgi:hypothetical protein